MGKSLDWYQERWENNLKVILFAHNSSIQASTEYGRGPQLLTEITETPPDVVEVVEPDQNSFEDHLQAWTEKDVEVFDQVRLNIDKAQEKQKESYRSRIKKVTKSYNLRVNYLVWKKDERKAKEGRKEVRSWCNSDSCCCHPVPVNIPFLLLFSEILPCEESTHLIKVTFVTK
ncbi:uncharacterized protein ACWYII_024126 [Salvelinus alpinus]